MPLLTNIEQRAIARTAKETRQQDILDLLEDRFGFLPKNLIKEIKQIDDLTFLKQLLIETIKVNSFEEFEQLVNSNSKN